MSTQPASLIGVRTIAGLLILAPLCDFLESALSPLTTSTTAADLAAIHAHETRFVVSVLIGLVGTVLFVPALLGLTAVTVRRSPVLSRIAAALAVVGMLGFFGIRLGKAVELQGIRDGVATNTTAGLLDHLSGNPLGLPIMVLFLGGTVLGMFVLAAATWRAGLPKPAAVMLAVFPVAGMGLESAGGSAVAHLVLLAGLGWLGVHLARESRTAATGQFSVGDLAGA